MLSEGRKSKGEQFKWGEELIFPAEELSSLILLPTNLMKFWVSGGGKLFRILFIPRGTSPGQVLQSPWQQLTDLCPILNRFQQYKEGPPDASIRVVLGFSCCGRSWGLPGKGLWRNPSRSQIATFLGYISLYCVQLIIMSFWWSCNSVKLHSIGYDVEVFLVLAWGLVYPLRSGQEKYRIHLSLFLCLPFLFLPQQHAFFFSFHISRMLLPSLPAHTSSLPGHNLFPPAADSTDRRWLQQQHASPSSSWRGLNALICQGWITAFQQQTSGKMERNKDWFFSISQCRLHCLAVPHSAWNLSPVVDKGLRIRY